MIDTTEKLLPISITITKAERKQAYQFAEEQNTPAKAEQVYRNTLAVLVTQRYLQLLGITTTTETSNSWNTLNRLLENVADLYIPQLQGILECRPVHGNDSKCSIPEEVWEERLGYIVVQLDHPYQEAQILGFVETVSVSELPLSYLQSLDNLTNKFLEQTPEDAVSLRQWLQERFESDWQPTSDLLGTMGAMVWRSASVARSNNSVRQQIEKLYRQSNGGKIQPFPDNTSDQEVLANLIKTTQSDNLRWQFAELLWEINPNHPDCPTMTAKDLGIYLQGYRVALAIGVLPKQDGSLLIMTRVYPLGKLSHLPLGLMLSGLEENGNKFFEVEAREQDNYIQFKFTANAGDHFMLCVVLNDTSFVESFMV